MRPYNLPDRQPDLVPAFVRGLPEDGSGQLAVFDADGTLWRDDVYTPGLSLVGLSMLSVGHAPLALTWGGDYYHDQMDTDGYVVDRETGDSTALVRETATGSIPSGRFPDGARADRAGLFASAELETTKWLRLSLGARLSHFENRADVGLDMGGAVENISSDLSGQLGVVVAPADEWRLAFRLAEGFRAPNLYDLTNVGPVPGGIVLPNPNARPERSLSTELGVRYAAERAALDVTVYHTRIKDSTCFFTATGSLQSCRAFSYSARADSRS